MTRLAPLIFASLTVFCLVELPAATARMPLDEVKVGMTGIGVTVFQGAEREEFRVHVLGVLQNVMGPRRNVIVARLEGGPLADTGVIQGMSGSPVYIDDRLVGAVSYSLGSFSTESIAGITPIEEMVETDATPVTVARNAARALQLPLTRDSLGALVRTAFNRVEPFAVRPADVQVFGLTVTDGERLGALLRPIATPLILGGFVPEMHDLWASAFNPGGFVTTVGGAVTSQEQATRAPLMPGDAIGVGLISGDITLAGTGTVTMVQDGRVYAFGHPFYNLGAANFPMTRARVMTLLPSLAISSKIAAIGDVVGTIDQDRATGIFGTLGPGPEMVPVRVSLSSPDRDVRETFTFEVIRDRLFTPLLTYTSVLNTFLSWTRELGATTYVIEETTGLRNQRDVTFRDVYSGDMALVAAAAAVAEPLTVLLGNTIAPVVIERIEIDITALEEPRTATLDRVWLDAVRPRAGDRVPLKVLSRNFRGAEIVETLMIDIPANAAGRLQILVSDARQLRQREAQEGRTPRDATTLAQLIRTLNRTRRNSRLYVRLLSPDAGAVVNGEALPALPPSVLAVLESNRSNSGSRRLRQATLHEWEIETDYVVSGSRVLTINVEAG